jgi:hypothetical protein
MQDRDAGERYDKGFAENQAKNALTLRIRCQAIRI